MNNESLSIKDSWVIAQQVAEFAYIHQKQCESPQIQKDVDIENTLKKVASLLNEQNEAWQKSKSPLFEVASVNRLAEIFTYMMKGELNEAQKDSSLWKFLAGSNIPTNNPLDEDGLKLAIWQTLNSPDSSEYNDYELALKYKLPTKEEITEKGGPQDFAKWYWHDQGGKSETTIRNYREKINNKKLVLSLERYFIPFTERNEYIGAVCGGLLKLNKSELLLLSEEFKALAAEL